MQHEYLAIHNQALLAKGDILSIIREVKAHNTEIEPYVFECDSCKRIDVNWQGSAEDVIRNLPENLAVSLLSTASKKRGRPKLGVISKEVTLLPEHWEWLSVQRGGASITLRRLIDTAMSQVSNQAQVKIKQNQLYNLMTVFSDSVGFEAASRALYRHDFNAFVAASETWNEEIRALLLTKFSAILSLLEESHHD